MIAAGWIVAQILVRNVEERLKTSLQKRAKQNGHSVEAEVREILRDALKAKNAKSVGFGTASVALFSSSGFYLDEPIEEIRGMRMEIPNFEA
jgi:plasmid stability protein